MPARKPTALKVLEGDFEKNPNRRNKAEPVPPRLDHYPPPGALTPTEKAVWERLARYLTETRVLSDADLEALSLLCHVTAKHEHLTEMIRAEGQVLTKVDAQGNVIRYRHPATVIQVAALGQMVKLWSQLGMTPASRHRVSVVEGTDESLAADRERFLA